LPILPKSGFGRNPAKSGQACQKEPNPVVLHTFAVRIDWFGDAGVSTRNSSKGGSCLRSQTKTVDIDSISMLLRYHLNFLSERAILDMARRLIFMQVFLMPKTWGKSTLVWSFWVNNLCHEFLNSTPQKCL
jgi:hypothetical protein